MANSNADGTPNGTRAADAAGSFLSRQHNRFVNLLLIVCGLLWLSFAVWWLSPSPVFTALALGLQLVAGTTLTFLVIRMLKRDLIEPLIRVNTWTQRMLAGELSARVSGNGSREFTALASDLNGVAEFLQNLSQNVDGQVRKHTEYIEQKNRALEIIYDVAGTVNVGRDLEELLTRFLSTVMDVVEADAAMVRLRTEDDQMKLIASIGISDEVIERERLLPLSECACGEVCENGGVFVKHDLQSCHKVIGIPLVDTPMTMISVPLRYRDNILGVYNLLVKDRTQLGKAYVLELLANIGRHLGMAIDKARMDNEAYRLSIMEERTSLAHELHDSLAQTLASLRFQVRVLDETLHTNDEPAVWRELEKIENSLDEAHSEIRELITHFRAPIDKRGLIPAIKNLVDRFRKQTDINVYFQDNWLVTWLPAEVEVQVVHIVQEALTNIRKHSKAQNVRVLMQSDYHNRYRIFIEDDGIGMGEPQNDPLDQHVGLSIMEERAKRINGRLRFESEPGEGTQIILTFPPTSAQNKRVFNP